MKWKCRYWWRFCSEKYDQRLIRCGAFMKLLLFMCFYSHRKWWNSYFYLVTVRNEAEWQMKTGKGSKQTWSTTRLNLFSQLFSCSQYIQMKITVFNNSFQSQQNRDWRAINSLYHKYSVRGRGSFYLTIKPNPCCLSIASNI